MAIRAVRDLGDLKRQHQAALQPVDQPIKPDQPIELDKYICYFCKYVNGLIIPVNFAALSEGRFYKVPEDQPEGGYVYGVCYNHASAKGVGNFFYSEQARKRESLPFPINVE